MTRRRLNNLGLRLYYSGNVSSYCGSRDDPAPCASGTAAVTPALAAPPLITGVDATAASGSLTFEVRVVGDPVAGIQNVWITWTIPPAGAGNGTWQSLDLVQDPDDSTLWTGTLTTPTPGAVRFLAQAADGVGHVTLDHNFGALYALGAIPGPLDPGETPPAATTLQFTAGPPSTVQYGASFSATVDLNGSGAEVIDVVEGSPAADALRPGDVIVAIDGTEIEVATQVGEILNSSPVGTAFQYRCNGREPLQFICVTMPPWRGDAEATVIDGPWEPNAPMGWP